MGAKVEKRINVLKDNYAALQQKIRNMKKNWAENETLEESKSEKATTEKSESSVSKKKGGNESSSNGKGRNSKKRKCG